MNLLLDVNYGYAWRNGWRWIWSYVRLRRSPVAVLRFTYWTLVRGHQGEACSYCGRPYMSWRAPDDLWRLFSGNAGLCCPACFDRRNRERGSWLSWAPTQVAYTLERDGGLEIVTDLKGNRAHSGSEEAPATK